MKFVAGNAQNIGARPQQQDAFGFSDPGDPKFVAHAGFLGVVADGMGGLTHGSEASRSAVLAFLDAYKRKTVAESIPKALTRCLGEANLGVLRVAQSVPAGDEVGTTLVAAALHDHTLHWISVGDSRIYLLRGNALTQLTADHVYARALNRQVAEGKISLHEALSHPERSSLTSYLGQVDPAHVDKNIRPLPVHNDDCVILCSDGFYRALTEQEVVAGLRSGPQSACNALVEQALAKHRKQQDNLTVIALKRYTRAPISKTVKLALAATAMLLILISGAGGYAIGKYLAANTMSTAAPPIALPSFALTKTGTKPGMSNQHASGQTAQTTQPPKPQKPPQKAGGPPKKNDTGKSGSEPTTTPPTPPPASSGTSQSGQGQPTEPPAGAPGAGTTPDKSSSSQTGQQDQQQGQPQTQGTAPAAPTTTPTPSTDDKKKDTPAPPPDQKKDDQPKTPPPQNDNPPNPPQSPNSNLTDRHTQIEG